MEPEAKFWLGLAFAVSLGFSALVACITVGTIQTDRMYYDSLDKCIAAGGVWLPINMGSCSK